MKHFAVTWLLVLFFSLHAEGKPFAFALNGKAQCVIALPENASKFDRMAAKDLQSYLGRMTGAKFRITAEDKVQGKAVYLGQSAAAAKAGLKDFTGEEWCIASPDGEKLILTGSRPIGTFYAVWALLNKLGCYALTWDADAVPQNKNASCDGKFERKQPAFAGRLIHDGYFYHFRTLRADKKVIDACKLWLLRSRINGSQVLTMPTLYNYGSFRLAQPHQHHTLDIFVPPEKYFKSHPEYFTMNEFGKRIAPFKPHYGSNLCMSNPEVAEVTLQSLREFIKADHAKHPREEWATVYEISRLDAIPYICKCPKCTAISKEEKTEVGLQMRYINKVATEIRKEYPEIIIKTNGALASNPPPEKTLPAENVLVRIGEPLSKCDPFVPITHPLNQVSRQQLEAWRGKAKRFAFWDYWNLGDRYFTPPRVETVFDAIQSDFRYFRDLGVTDLFIESTRDFASPQNFIDLNYFVANQLMIDPDDDPEKLADIFFRYYYGPAAPALKKWFNEIREGVKKQPTKQSPISVGNWCYADVPFLFNSYLMLKQQAEALPEKSVYRERVERERITVLWSILAHRHSFSKVLKTHQLTPEMLIGECRDLVRKHIRRYPSKRPQLYDRKFEERFKSCVNTLVIPEKFKNVPEENFRMVAWPDMRDLEKLDAVVCDDPDSIQGKAVRSAHRNPAFHGVNVRLPGKHGFRSTYFELGNSSGYSGKISVTLKEVPQDEKYHWFRIPGKMVLKEKSCFWGHGWAIQAGTSHLFTLTDGSAADNTWDEVWFSAKFTGPAYVKNSAKENAIWVDMIVLIRKSQF